MTGLFIILPSLVVGFLLGRAWERWSGKYRSLIRTIKGEKK